MDAEAQMNMRMKHRGQDNLGPMPEPPSLDPKSIHFYCINLRHRTDRWTSFSSQPAVQDLRSNYTFEKFDAVVGSTLDIQADPRISMRTKRNIREKIRRDHEDLNTAGGVGCYLSHVEIWKRIANNPEPYGIIFEDDARIPPKFLSQLSKAFEDMTLLPEKPDIWTFSYSWNFYYTTKGRALPQDIPDNIRGPWILNTCPGGLTGYMLTKEGAKKLLETAFPIDMHVDLYICLCQEMKRVNCVAHRGVIVSVLSESAKSDIQLPSGCAICDVPTNLDQRGLTLVNIPIAMFAVIAMAGIAWLSRSGGRR